MLKHPRIKEQMTVFRIDQLAAILQDLLGFLPIYCTYLIELLPDRNGPNSSSSPFPQKVTKEASTGKQGPSIILLIDNRKLNDDGVLSQFLKICDAVSNDCLVLSSAEIQSSVSPTVQGESGFNPKK